MEWPSMNISLEMVDGCICRLDWILCSVLSFLAPFYSVVNVVKDSHYEAMSRCYNVALFEDIIRLGILAEPIKDNDTSW